MRLKIKIIWQYLQIENIWEGKIRIILDLFENDVIEIGMRLKK